MKFCYFIWALSVTSGIFLFNLLVLKNCDINFFYKIFLIIISITLALSGFFSIKKHLNIKKANAIFLTFTFLLFLILGFISASLNYLNNNEFCRLAVNTNIFKSKDVEIAATGLISNNPSLKFGSVYFDFEISKLRIINKENENNGQLNNCGNIFISYKNKFNSDLQLNDLILLNLTGVNAYSDKAGNNYYIFSADKIIHTEVSGLSSYFYIFKSKIHACLNLLYEKNLNKSNSKIAAALILGNQSEIPQKITDSFKKSGIYHLLAISGLHVSIIAAFICFMFKKISFSSGFKKFNISYFVVFFLIFYNFVAGEKSSMIRASIMFGLALFARDLHKDIKQANLLFTAYIVLLLVSPNYLNSPGFILSFASVAAIIFIIPVLKKSLNYFLKLKKPLENYFIRSIIAALSINIFISPVLSYYFGGFSLIAIIANLAVAPVFYLLLLDLFISSVAATFWFAIGSFCIIPADFLTGVILKLSDFFISLPYSFVSTDIFKNKFALFLYYLILIIIIASLQRFFKRKEVKNNIKNIV